MDAALTLHLFGPLRIELGRAPLPGLSRRAQAMLAFLARQPGMRAERAFVADLLWSDRSGEQARNSLRQELSVMRRLLPRGVMEASRQHVWLDPARILLPAGTGPLLQGFDLASEGFEDWLRSERSAQDDAPVPQSPALPRALPRDRPTLAVLPFDEWGVDDNDMFADGVVEEITGALSRVHEFHVIARQSAFALRGASLPVPEAAKKLGADYLVEGSVRRSGARVRISVQLVWGQDGHTLWTERFDDRLDDLFDLQDRIAAQVAGQVSPNLRAAEIERARTHLPEDRSAYELYLTALPHFWSHTRASNAQALTLLDRALAADPQYGPALAYKAWVLAQQLSYVWSDDPEADRARAKDIVRQATPLVANHAPSLVALGAAITLVSVDFDQANAFIDRALTLDPNNAWGWMRRGWLRNYEGRNEEARGCFDQAEALSPLDPFLFNIEIGRGGSYLGEKRHAEALPHLQHGLRLSPSSEWVHRLIAVTYINLGQPEKAVEALKTLRAAYPDLTVRKVASSIPPTIIENQPGYCDALRKAGLPEE